MKKQFYRKDFSGSTRFGVLDAGVNSDQMPAAWVDLTHESEYPREEWETSPRPDLPVDQLEMFEREPAEVTGAFAHPTLAHTVPTLLGMAVNKNAGRIPLPSDSLSTHSSRMVKHLRSSGVDVPKNSRNPESEPTNKIAENGRDIRMTGYDVAHGVHPVEWMDKGAPEVQAGSQTARRILRSARKPPAAAVEAPPNHNQLQFKGFA